MTEADWLTATDPRPMLEFLRGQASDRKLRLFAVACCRRVWDGLRDERSRRAVESAERFADGNEPLEAMLVAREVAYVAVDDCLDFSPFSEDQAVAAYLVASEMVDESREHHDPYPGDAVLYGIDYAIDGLIADSNRAQTILLRDIFNPFRPVVFDPAWRSETVAALAAGIYAERAFDRLPILADSLEEAGCDQPDILNHCRGPGPHVRGCWAVDLVLGKE